MKTIEVLYFEGCPNVEVASDCARRAVETTGVLAEVKRVRIENHADAVRRHFLGSPTIRVDGQDVDVWARDRMDFGLHCRVYEIDGKLAGAPPAEWIEAALRCSADTTNTRRS